MDSVQIVKALAKAGRRDLAEAAATDYEARWATMISEEMKKAATAIEAGNAKLAWRYIWAVHKLQKQLIAMLDGGTAEPKEVALLDKVIQLLQRRIK
jgi:hypothetical protein